MAVVIAAGCGQPNGGNHPPGGNCLGEPLAKSLGRSHLLIGLSGDDASAKAAPFDVRYQYLAGGIFDGTQPCSSCASNCTAGGTSCVGGGCGWWGCWQSDQVPPGQFVRDYVSKVSRDGQVPMLTYYEILHASGATEGEGEVAAIANVGFMTRYFADVRFLLQQLASATAIVHFEPDFWGYAEQHDTDPHRTPAAVASANSTDCADQANTMAGFGRCLVKMARRYAPQVEVGLHASAWSTKLDVLANTDPSFDVTQHAAMTSAFLGQCGAAESDFVAVDYSDRDAGYYASMGRNTWWDEQDATLPNFKQALTWTGAIAQHAAKPVIVWQLPVGNRSLNNTCDHFQDNRVDHQNTRSLLLHG